MNSNESVGSMKTASFGGNKTKINKTLFARLLLYIAGIFLLGFGIVLCVKCKMGVSPINSVPYVITHFIPLSLGTVSIFFYLVNIAAEFLLSERKYYIGILLQLPVALAFGTVIDFWDALIPAAGSMGMRIIFLCGSLFFTAFGIMVIVAMRLVPDPPTGAVQAISRAAGKKMGSVKIVYDCSCVVLSLTIGLIGAQKVIGFGLATIASAICVGRILAFLQGTVGKRLQQYFPEQED